MYWLHNEMYFLKQEDKDILFSQNTWLNDRIMDVARKLIWRGYLVHWICISQFSIQKKQTENLFHPASQDYVQLLHDGSNHWFLSFCSSGRVQICDSLRSRLTSSSRKSICLLYKHYVPNGGEELTRSPMVTTVNCSRSHLQQSFLMDAPPSEVRQFHVNEMRKHLIKGDQTLTPFSKADSD